MKISPEHYNLLRNAIKPLVPLLQGHRAKLILEGKAKNVEKRIRWDALWAAKFDGKSSSDWISIHLYPFGVNDNHIDTALRNIMIDLGVTPK